MTRSERQAKIKRGEPLVPSDLVEPDRSSGYRNVGMNSSAAYPASKPYQAYDGRSGGPTKKHVWKGPRRATAAEAAQDYCDYINGQQPSVAPALASHGHARQKPKRKVQRNAREIAALKVLREEAAKRKVEQSNYIYLVGMEGNPAYVKIGEAFDPEDRYISGQTFNPYTLVLLAYQKTDIARDADKAVHRELAEHHHRAEWFHPSDAVLSKFNIKMDEFLRRCGGKTEEVT